jgi:hypothetical protein
MTKLTRGSGSTPVNSPAEYQTAANPSSNRKHHKI